MKSVRPINHVTKPTATKAKTKARKNPGARKRLGLGDLFTMAVAGLACLRGVSPAGLSASPAPGLPTSRFFGAREGVNLTVGTLTSTAGNIANVSLSTTNRGNKLVVANHPGHGWSVDVYPSEAAGIGVLNAFLDDITQPGIGPRLYPLGVDGSHRVNLTLSTVPLEDAHRQTASLVFETPAGAHVSIDDASGAWHIQARATDTNVTQVDGPTP